MPIAGRYTFQIDELDPLQRLVVSTDLGEGSTARVIYDAESVKFEDFTQFKAVVDTTKTATGYLHEIRIEHDRSRDRSLKSDFGGPFFRELDGDGKALAQRLGELGLDILRQHYYRNMH